MCGWGGYEEGEVDRGVCWRPPALILMVGGWDRFTAEARHFSIRQQRCTHTSVFCPPGIYVCVLDLAKDV